MRSLRLCRALPAPLLPMMLLGACTTARPPTIALETPAPPVAIGPALPDGASPGMLVPQPLADGSFPTPNLALSGPGAMWHLRAGLNVAALSCGGEQGAAIRAGYNRWLARAKAPLAQAARGYAAEYHASTRAGRDAFDDAMTRLYNFFAQTPPRAAFCTAAASTIADIATADAAALPSVAEARLATLDQPFTDFYRAYDAWRSGRGTTVIAAATVPPTPALSLEPASTTRPTRLVLDLSGLPIDTTVIAKR